MPKVKYTRAKGLVQEAGTGFDVSKYDGVTAGGMLAEFFPNTVAETSSGAGALSPVIYRTNVVTTGANALTLAAGDVKGMRKVICLTTDGGDGTLTIADAAGHTQIVFSNKGDTAELIWNGTGWRILATYNTANGGVASPVASTP